jgi:O-antigen ligase
VRIADVGEFAGRLDTVRAEVYEPSGYRISEARVGLHAFLASPIVGQGLGQVEPDRFLRDFGVTDVGPVYHVFYVGVLANAGLVGLALLLWPLARARGREWARDRQSLGFRALLVGFAAAAVFAGPTDGHWELGLLPALVLLAKRFEEREHR